MKHNSGFTLLELIISLSVVVASVHFVATGLNALVNTNQLNSIATKLGTDLHLARGEAIARNTRVTLEKSGSGWEQGWKIFVDSNHNAELDKDEQLLKQQNALTQKLTLRGNRPVKNYLSYVGNGLTRTKNGGMQAGTFMLCNAKATADSSNARAIIISTSGRPRISKKNSDLKKRNCGV